MHYTQMGWSERLRIYFLLECGHSLPAIARRLGRHPTTIRRELKRNARAGLYSPGRAQRLVVERRGLKRMQRIGAQVWREVELKIREDWSPEQVAGHRRRCRKSPVSHEWIYQHIWQDKRAGGTLWHHLRQRGCRGRRDRKYGRRGLIAGRIGIETRPAHIEARTRIGDWEVDTVFGAGHEGVLVSLTERKTRLEVLARVADKSAPAVRFGIVSAP